MARIVRRTEVNECRQCATFCDRVIAPATCVADDCPNLYTYDDPLTGRLRHFESGRTIDG